MPHSERLRRWLRESEVDVVAERLEQAKQDFLVDIDMNAFRSIYKKDRARDSEPLRKKLKQSDKDDIAIVGLEDEPLFAFDSALAMAYYGGNDDVSQWRNENWYTSFMLAVQPDKISWSKEEHQKYLRSIRNDFWSVPENRQAASERSKAWYAIAANKAYHAERSKAGRAELKADPEKFARYKAMMRAVIGAPESRERARQRATETWAQPGYKATMLATNKAFSAEHRKEYYDAHPEYGGDISQSKVKRHRRTQDTETQERCWRRGSRCWWFWGLWWRWRWWWLLVVTRSVVPGRYQET